MSNPAEHMTAHGATLRADNLAADAGPLRLFSGLSFAINSGEALILRGANGSGKTTLLRMIAGLYPRAAGTVAFTNMGTDERYALPENCHFLGHKNGLKSQQTVRENLRFFAEFDGGGAEAPKTLDQTVEQSVERAAAALSIGPLLDLPAGLLSAGQARRAAFARLLVSSRAVWCLDEPTAALDAPSRQSVEALCRAHLSGGGLLIASTHLPFLTDIKGRKDLNLTPALAGYNEAAL